MHSDFGGTNFQVTKMVLTHYGLVSLKDVQILSIGEEKVILDAKGSKVSKFQTKLFGLMF
jgi:hypothetical protein